MPVLTPPYVDYRAAALQSVARLLRNDFARLAVRRIADGSRLRSPAGLRHSGLIAPYLSLGYLPRSRKVVAGRHTTYLLIQLRRHRGP